MNDTLLETDARQQIAERVARASTHKIPMDLTGSCA